MLLCFSTTGPLCALAWRESLHGCSPMIQLTRLNNLGLLVNCDLIKFVETAPDTVLTLVSGEKIVVRESPEEVLAKIIRFRRTVFAQDTGGSQTAQTEGGSANAESARDSGELRKAPEQAPLQQHGERGPNRG